MGGALFGIHAASDVWFIISKVQEEIIPSSLWLRASSWVLLGAAPMLWRSVQPKVLEAFFLHHNEVTEMPQECGAESFFLPQLRSDCFSLKKPVTSISC